MLIKSILLGILGATISSIVFLVICLIVPTIMWFLGV